MAENQIVPKIEQFTLMIESVISFIDSYLSQDNIKKITKIFMFSNCTNLRFTYNDQLQILNHLKSYTSKAIFLPAYTYNSRSQIPFSVEQQPSAQNGSMSRVTFESNLHCGNRTQDEDYSYFIINQAALTSDDVKELKIWKKKSFGTDSHHANLFISGAIFFCLGNGLKDGFTPMMHLEAMAGVPYREYQPFKSMMYHDRTKLYYARKEKEYNDFGKGNRERLLPIIKELDGNNFSFLELSQKSTSYFFTLKSFMTAGLHKLTSDPTFFIR